MTHPYVPPQPGGPGAYEQQLAARCRRLEEENLQLRRDRESLETDLGKARQRIEAAKRWARMTQRLGTSDEAGLAQAVLLKLGVPFEEAAAPQKAGRP